MKFLNLGCPQKHYKNENSELFSFSMQLQIRHYKTKYRINSAFKQETKRKKKLATKEKKKEKNTAYANINSREVLKIE